MITPCPLVAKPGISGSLHHVAGWRRDPIEWRGRAPDQWLTLGLADIQGDALIGAGYGVSGGSWSDQLPWVKAFVSWARLLGLPFVLGADWQVTPAVVRQTGIRDL